MGTLTDRNRIRGRLIRKALSVALLILSTVVLFEIPPPVQAQSDCRQTCKNRCRADGPTCLWSIRSCDAGGCNCHIYCSELVVV